MVANRIGIPFYRGLSVVRAVAVVKSGQRSKRSRVSDTTVTGIRWLLRVICDSFPYGSSTIRESKQFVAVFYLGFELRAIQGVWGI